MFEKAIWDLGGTLENFGNLVHFSNTKAILSFSIIARVIYPQNSPNQTFNYWLITPNNKHFVLKLISFNSG